MDKYVCQRPHLITMKNPNHLNQTIHTSAIHVRYFTNPHVTNFSQRALHSYSEFNEPNSKSSQAQVTINVHLIYRHNSSGDIEKEGIHKD